MILIKVLRFTLAISFACTLSACNLAIQEKLSVLDFNLRKSLKIDGIGLTSGKEKKEAKITNISPIVSQQVNKKEKIVVADSKTNKNKPNVRTKNSLTTTTITKIIEPELLSFLKPVTGETLRQYKKGSSDGIDISAASGAVVRAVADGRVIAVTQDTEQRFVLILRHRGNLLTIYANISNISVQKDEIVQAGQKIATVSSGKPSFLHFEVREGMEAVDPSKYF